MFVGIDRLESLSYFRQRFEPIRLHKFQHPRLRFRQALGTQAELCRRFLSHLYILAIEAGISSFCLRQDSRRWLTLNPAG